MTAATRDLTEMRERLLTRLTEIDLQLTALKISLVEATDSQLDEGTLANHQADEASDMLRAETDLTRIYTLFQEQRDIAAAFERMDAGVYGTCIDCGTEIHPGRLDVIPIAKRCLNCQVQKEEQTHPRQPFRRIGMEETFRV